MRYFVIRHKATGELMPEAKKRKGYSHWNPNKPHSFGAALDIPRLFTSEQSAKRSIVQWAINPNGTSRGYQSYNGDWDEYIDTKPDGRSKTDLEVCAVELTVEN